jgi:hypothetical protein
LRKILGRFQCWLFFYYFSLITSQQNHAQTRYGQVKKTLQIKQENDI